jgi:hypothetical protein
MTDIVERLRNWHKSAKSGDTFTVNIDDIAEAADEIERLRKDIEILKQERISLYEVLERENEYFRQVVTPEEFQGLQDLTREAKEMNK